MRTSLAWVIILKVIGIHRAAISNQKSETFKRSSHYPNLPKSKLDDNISMFVGMDLHKNYLQIAVMNEKGKVLENSRINNNLKQMGRFFDENIKKSNEKVRVVIESSSEYMNITYTVICLILDYER